MAPTRLSCDAGFFDREMERLLCGPESLCDNVTHMSGRCLVRSRALMDLNCIYEEDNGTCSATSTRLRTNSTTGLGPTPGLTPDQTLNGPEQTCADDVGTDADDKHSRWSIDSGFSAGTMGLPVVYPQLDAGPVARGDVWRPQSLPSEFSNSSLRTEYSRLLHALDLGIKVYKCRGSASNFATVQQGFLATRLPRRVTNASVGRTSSTAGIETRVITLPHFPIEWKLEALHSAHDTIELDDVVNDELRSHQLRGIDELRESAQLDSVMNLFLVSLKLVEEHENLWTSGSTTSKEGNELHDISYRRSSAIFQYTPTWTFQL